MYPGGFFIPHGSMNFAFPRTIGGFYGSQNIFNKLFSGIRSFNWKGLINGASKTLNVVNQTIPIIKEARPAINNVKNVIHIVKSFNKETNYSKNRNIKPVKKIINEVNDSAVKENNNYDYPTFFV